MYINFKFFFNKIFIKFLNYQKSELDAYFNKYLLQTPKFYGNADSITISKKSNVNNALFNSASGKIVISDYVFFGHNVSVIAATHDMTKFGIHRIYGIPKEGYDIIIEEGAWIGSNSLIIGPCKIGKNSVVAAGSVVIKDVGDFHVVGGVPAKFIKELKQV